MNVAEFTVDRELARDKLRAYRSRKHKEAEQEYRAAEKLFEAAAKGARLLVAGDVIRNSPFDEQGRPKLAIARADRKQVCLFRRRSRITFDSRADYSPYDEGRHSQLLHDYHSMPEWKPKQNHSYDRWFATVPMVPADVRPETGQLRQWHILWEVDQWHRNPIVDPPRDPFLLRRVSGDVFEVIAEWDLTPIEQEAMRLAVS